MRLSKAPRSGTVLVCVMACLAVAIAITTITVQSTLQSRQFICESVNLQQAEYLCEAAAMRARRGILADRSYTGELWSPILSTTSQLEANIELTGKLSSDGTRFDCYVKCRLLDSDTRVISVQRSQRFSCELSTYSWETK